MSETVRVRFAPSPTGPLHVGGLRTALYNYLFARKAGGVFVLRIEDTDRARFVPGATEQLIDALAWAGLVHDEGPGAGGPFGPYYQSQRLQLYTAAAERLLAEGRAYPCFCTPDRLEAMRKDRKDTRYDRTCLRLSAGDAHARMVSGERHTVRMRIPDGATVEVDDLVRGRVGFGSDTIDDQVLLKSDGFPTYHLANVVDDHEMGITHVIRGEEWLTSAPKHVLLYRFLGWDPPRFAHLPLLLNPDRSKLSKRVGDVAVQDYRAQGYFPEALINFVAFLGWNPGDEREIFSLEELVDVFSLERVNKSGAIFNLEKLRWFNQEYLARKPVESIETELRPLLVERGWTAFDSAYVHRVIDLMRERLAFVHDFPALASWFFVDPESYDGETVAKRWKPTSPALLAKLLPRLSAAPAFDAQSLERLVKDCAAEEGVGAGELIHPLRLAVSGVGKGPGLYEILEALGQRTCARRVGRAIEALGPGAA